jgi:dTDP-4-amino-4,6-dideoxygalactose transaminase
VRPLLSRTPLTTDSTVPPVAANGRAVLTHRGRTALWHGLRALGLRRGDRALFPAYCCGAELEVLLQAGLEPVFYPVGAGAVPDRDAIASLLRREPRALFLIHYFGLPVPLAGIRSLARERGVLLIEDCAHALFAFEEDGTGIGSHADLAVFSLPKHLPVPNGGLMVLHQDGATEPTPSQGGAPWRVSAKSLAYVLATEVEHRLPAVHDRLRRLIGRPAPADAGDVPADSAATAHDAQRFEPAATRWTASVATRALLRRADGARIRERRRAHYLTLAAALGEGGQLRLLRPKLAAGASPYLLPLLAERPDAFQRFMLAHGVETVAVWRHSHRAVPALGFPGEGELRARLIGLPVHQGLRPRDVARIGELLELWRGRPDARRLPATTMEQA